MTYLPLSDAALRAQSPAALAYIGDCVFELLVRTEELAGAPAKVSLLHRRTAAQVKAAAQAAAARRIQPSLTEDEKSAFLRGRNTKTHQAPKGATTAEYALATALEALFGWLYLSGQEGRLHELYALCREKEALSE